MNGSLNVANLLQDGLAWLEQQRTAHMTSPVTYRRAGQADAEVQATFGKTDYEVADGYGAMIRSHVIDFKILADELGFEPQASDVIVADGRKYEVLAIAGEEWRWSDPYRTTFRIHTKDIGDE
jgi:hypothetical protein